MVDLETLVGMGQAGKNVGEFCEDIVKLAINKNTKDNVSCIVISFKEWKEFILFLFFSYKFKYLFMNNY